MTIATSITKRERKRVLTSGLVVVHSRYVLNFRDPRSGKRRQVFCRSQKEAIAKRDNLLAAIATHTYTQSRTTLAVTGAVEHWLENRRPEVKASTCRRISPRDRSRKRRSRAFLQVAWADPTRGRITPLYAMRPIAINFSRLGSRSPSAAAARMRLARAERTASASSGLGPPMA